jgi:hypothetical protein
MTKPSVNYYGTAQFFKQPTSNSLYSKYTDEDGQVTRAQVFAGDHPVWGADIVTTSVVIKRYKNGNFETLNTKYKKVLDKQSVV